MRLIIVVILFIGLGFVSPDANAQNSCQLRWSPDGTQVFAVEGREQTTVIDLNTETTTVLPGRPIAFTFFDSTGTLMLIGDQLIDAATMTPVYIFAPETYPTMHSSGAYISTEAGIWSITDSAYVIDGADIDMDWDTSYAFRRDRETGIIDVFDPLTQVQFSLDTGGIGVARLDFDAESARMTVIPHDVAPRTAQLYDLTTGERIATLETTLDEIVSTRFIPGGNYVITLEYAFVGDSSAIDTIYYSVWDSQSGTLVERLTDDVRDLRDIGTNTFMYASGDRRSRALILWQDGEKTLISDLIGVELRNASTYRLSDDRWMVGFGNAVYIWTVDELLNRQPPGLVFTVQQATNGARINDSLTRLLTFSAVPVEITPVPPAIDSTLWNLETGEIILALMADRPTDGSFPTSEQIDNFPSLNSARFEGTFLLYRLNDERRFLHNAESGDLLVEGADEIEISPGGDQAAFIIDGSVMLLEAATGETRRLLDGVSCD